MESLTFAQPMSLPSLEALRAEARAFAADYTDPRSHLYLGGESPEFSAKMGAKGWIGMCWPKRYGGGEKSMLERYVVAEELLAARVPLGHHWIADRQAGPLLLKFGTEEQRQTILPKIIAGKCRFCIGMSEPGSGSDLASVSSRADKVQGGYLLNGSKVWISGAHVADYMIVLCRTSPRDDLRHGGLSQLLLDLKTPGIEIRPIRNLAGEQHFNEVLFTDVHVPEEMLIGNEGDGWTQVNSELAYERAGPERFFSSFGLLTEAVDQIGPDPSELQALEIGRQVAQVAAVRRLSRSVATMQHMGEMAGTQAAIVKDLGTSLEQAMADAVRSLAEIEPDPGEYGFSHSLAEVLLDAPSYSIRGGTREVLRGIIARGAGIR